MKPYVTSDPDICDYTLRPDDRFLVVASDGIWVSSLQNNLWHLGSFDMIPTTCHASAIFNKQDVLESEQVAVLTLFYSKSKSSKEDLTDLKWTAKRICDRAR